MKKTKYQTEKNICCLQEAYLKFKGKKDQKCEVGKILIMQTLF